MIASSSLSALNPAIIHRVLAHGITVEIAELRWYTGCMRFGIELEFYSDRLHNAQLCNALKAQGFDVRPGEPKCKAKPYWRLTEDGSINYEPDADPTDYVSDQFYDYELVSPILDTTNPEDIKTVRRIALALQALGCRVNPTCGFHVHVDASELTVEDVKRVFRRYEEFEDKIDKMFTPNRRGDVNEFCQALGYLIWNPEAETKEELIPRRSSYSADNYRYFKVNLQSLHTHGTIEFRQHQGTINSQTIINWVLFVTQFVEASKAKQPKKHKKVKPSLRATPGMAGVINYINEQPLMAIINVRLCAEFCQLAESTVLKHLRALSNAKPCAPVLMVGKRARRGQYIDVDNIGHPGQTLMPKDSMWRGISEPLQSFYAERIQELNP